MNKRNLVSSLLILIVCALVGVFGSHIRRARAIAQGTRFAPYTIVWQISHYDDGAQPQIVGTETRVKSMDGRWHSKKTLADGSADESFAEPGRGVFRIGVDELQFISDYPNVPPRSSLQEFLNSGQCLRTETIQGMTVAVMRLGAESELYVAPELGGDWIKARIRLPGSSSITVFEPVFLTRGEPDPARFERKELPVSRKAFEKMHSLVDK